MALATLVQDLILTALPGGGQAVARRNAWAAMSQDAVLARGRRDARIALAAAERRAHRRRSTGS